MNPAVPGSASFPHLPKSPSVGSRDFAAWSWKEIMNTYECFPMGSLSDPSGGDTQQDVTAGSTTPSEHTRWMRSYNVHPEGKEGLNTGPVPWMPGATGSLAWSFEWGVASSFMSLSHCDKLFSYTIITYYFSGGSFTAQVKWAQVIVFQP